MTVRALRQEMDQLEFVRWRVYYAKQAQRAELEEMKQRGRK